MSRSCRPKVSEEAAARKAVAEFEREQKRREAERRKEEAAREKERAKREKLVARAQASLDKAQREHRERAESLEAERAAIERRVQAEDARWQSEKEKLTAAPATRAELGRQDLASGGAPVLRLELCPKSKGHRQ
jgi:colicin import membrane protein